MGIVATGMMATGITMTYAAANDGVMVMDVSIAAQVNPKSYIKAGKSVLVDFKNNEINTYRHIGGGCGLNSGVSYSVGIVSNYTEAEDYKGHFIGSNLGKGISVDHSWSPKGEHRRAVQSTTVSFSFSSSPSGSSGVSYDYYSGPIKVFSWRRMVQ